jgi:glycosyltransferase involved in cell wall biosynthesis
MKNLSNIDVILPTIDEVVNLEILIPKLLSLKSVLINQIIVVDDSKTQTQMHLMEISKNWPSNVSIIYRSGKSGNLASAIYDGIKESKAEIVVWLDADNSMPPELIEDLYKNCDDSNQITIGSRFVNGGGYKGLTKSNEKLSIGWIIRIIKSKESISAILLSRILNKAIRFITYGDINDFTSGYIMCKREIALSLLPRNGYGEYCIEFLSTAQRKGFKVKEIGYLCLPRHHGYSKTGIGLYSLLKTGLPYLATAVKSRKYLYFFE